MEKWEKRRKENNASLKTKELSENIRNEKSYGYKDTEEELDAKNRQLKRQGKSNEGSNGYM